MFSLPQHLSGPPHLSTHPILCFFSLSFQTNDKKTNKTQKIKQNTIKTKIAKTKQNETNKTIDLFCIGQLLLGMVPILECGNTPKDMPLERTNFP